MTHVGLGSKLLLSRCILAIGNMANITPEQLKPMPWMCVVGDNDRAEISKKLLGPKDSRGNQDGNKQAKRTKPSRYVRQRARLPTGPESANYELPGWIGDCKFKQMMLIVFKTLANTQQRLRVMESVNADNFVVPSKIPAVAAGVAQAEAYHKQATTTATSEDMGAPAPQVLYNFCATLIKETDIGEEQRRLVMRDIVGKIQGLPKEKSTEVVAVFSIRACYDPDFHKIVLVSADPLVRVAFTQALKSVTGVRHYTAPAPPSGQEDEIQKWIEKLENVKDLSY